MNQKLSELLAKKRKKGEPNGGIDWDDRRNRYLDAVRDLYGQIEAALAEPISLKTVSVQRRPKDVFESYIGTYAVDDLLIVVGDEQVRFSPRGRNIVGAEGRVDVVGECGEAALILEPDAKWVFVRGRQPKLELVPFDDSTLAQVLQLVMRD